MRSDLSLVHAARFGNGDAFAQIVDRYSGVLLRFALRFVSDRGQAEEMAHDTLVDFYRHLDRYEPRAALGTYLCAILRNKALSARRKSRRVRTGSTVPEGVTADPAPLAGLIADERLMRMKGAVDGLPEPLRMVVELHYGEGLRLSDVAGVLSIPVGTVKSRLNRALTILRGLLGGSE